MKGGYTVVSSFDGWIVPVIARAALYGTDSILSQKHSF